jgi:hypothetical protein
MRPSAALDSRLERYILKARYVQNALRKRICNRVRNEQDSRRPTLP